MNQHPPDNCARIEALLPSYVEGDLTADDAAAVRSHVESCAACRESYAAFATIEGALVSRRSEVPAVDSFLPDLAAVRAQAHGREVAASAPAHSRLVSIFRTMMSVPGIAIILVVWSAMFLLRFRHTVGEMFSWTSVDRLSAFSDRISGALVGVSGGDPYALIAIYLALALLVLGSTGAITLRFIRHS